MIDAHIRLEHKLEFEAFAAFCKAIADAQDVVQKDKAALHVQVYGSAPALAGVASTPAKSVLTTDDDQETDSADEEQRERGKPAPGKARRTKAEIEEDEAADARDAKLAAANTETGAEVVDRQISTNPEDRVDPQDTADEATETASTKGEKVTHDDIRKALGMYVKKFGMQAAQEDGPKLIAKVLDDESKVKISDLPEGDQTVLKRALAGVEEMLTKNPFNRELDL